jgi:hypothetical protein
VGIFISNMFLCPPDRPLLHVAPLLLRLFYVIFDYSEKEMIFLLHIWIVHSCKNLENQTPTLERKAAQMLNGCVTNTQIHWYFNVGKFIYSSNSYTKQLYRYTEQDGCKGSANSNFSWDIDYPDCGFL